MQVDPQDLSRRDRYRMLISCLVPRPIAWISTLSGDGVANLAPFSFFGGVTSEPPTVMLSVGRRRGVLKDTAANLLATREGVIHVPSRTLAESMVATSAEVAPEVDEFEQVGLEKIPSVRVKPPRLANSAIAMETTLSQHLEVGAGPVDLFLLRVELFHVDDALLHEGFPDPAHLQAVGRLGGADYCDTATPFPIARPE